MTAITSGSSAVVTVTSNQQIAINSAPGVQCIVEATSGVPGSASKIRLANHKGGFAVYGPFGAGTVTLYAVGGAVDYDAAEPAESSDARAPVVADLGTGQLYANGSPVSGAGNLTTRRRTAANQFARAPLILAPAWAATTAYATGRRIRHSNGQVLLCVTGGTTGGTEPTFNAAQPMADGTAVWWSMARPSRVNADGYPVPTITASTTITGLTAKPLLANQSLYITPTCPNLIDVASGTAVQAWLFNDGGSSSSQGMGVGLRGYNRVTVFRSDAPKLALGIHNSAGSQFEVYVDGYKLEEDPTPFIAGNPSYYIIDWSSVGGRKMREYRVECAGNNNFKSIAVDAQSVIVPGNLSQATRGVYIGDSFGGTISTYTHPAQEYLSERVMRRLGITFTRNLHVGGTGYAATGTGGGSPYYAAAQLLSSNSQAGWDADFALFGHGYNDVGADVAAISAAAISAWRLMRAQQPRAFIAILGPWSAAKGPSANTLALDSALSAQFAAWGDTNAAFISVSQDPAGSWTTGTGKSTALTGTGNSDFYTGADGDHPTLNGKVYLEDKIFEACDALLTAAGR